MPVSQPFLHLRNRLVGDTVVDHSPNAHPITVSGVVEVDDPDFGPCFEFGARENHDDGTWFEAELTCPATFTFAAWIRRESFDENKWHSLIEFGDSRPQFGSYDIRLELSDGGLTRRASERLPRETWVHVAATYDPAPADDPQTPVTVLYEDGVEVARVPGAVALGGTSLRIGRGRGSSQNRPFVGRMAQILIYDRALDVADVHTVMCSTRGGITAPTFYLDDTVPAGDAFAEQSLHEREVLNHGVVEVRDADFGSCFEFPGEAYFEAALACPESFTFALWVKRARLSTGVWHSLIEFDDNQPQLCLRDLAPQLNDAEVRVRASERLPHSEWHHLAVTRDAIADETVLYLDGIEIDRRTNSISLGGATLRIGRGVGTSNYPFEGRMAQVLIYDRALSIEAVQRVMELTHKSFRPTLLLKDTGHLADGIVPLSAGEGAPATAIGMSRVEDDQLGPVFAFGVEGYLELPDQRCPEAFTISTWLRREPLNSTNWHSIVEYGNNSPQLGISNYRLGLIDGPVAADELPHSQWLHAAATYNPISRRSALYIDGVRIGTADNPIATGVAGLLVGKGVGSDNRKFRGRMGHLAVHDTALSAADLEVIRAYGTIRPLMNLPLDTVDATGHTPDLADPGRAVTCVSVGTVNDAKFGAAMQFDGVDDTIRVPGMTCPGAFTFAAFVYPDGSQYNRAVNILEFGTDNPHFGLLNGRPRLYRGPIAGEALKPGAWHHVALTYDDTTNTAAVFVNGEMVATHDDFAGTTDGVGLGIGQHVGTGFFKGRMRHVRIYDRPLTPSELRNVIIDCEPVGGEAPSVLTRPVVGLLALDLVNDDDEPVLYINHTRAQCLWLAVENTSAGDIALVPSELPVAPDRFHFQLHFRPGVLDSETRAALLAGTGPTVEGLDGFGWDLHFDARGSGGDVISLLWRGASVPAADGAGPPVLRDGVIGAGQREMLPLDGIRVKAGSGSRTTRVLMRHDLMRLPDETVMPPGKRIELLNILYRSQPSACTADGLPLSIGFVGSTTVLNDGGASSLTLVIRNTRRADGIAQPLDMAPDGALADDVAPKLILSLEAPIDGANLAAITCSVDAVQGGSWTSAEPNARPWVLSPPARIAADGIATVTLGGIKTTAEACTAYLVVRYEDIHQFGEGERRIPFQIAPLKYERHGDRDTVVIRHGDHFRSDPRNEALFVETSEGEAARLHGGRVHIIRRTDQSDPIDASGWQQAICVDALTSGSGLYVHQDGTGNAAEFVGGGGVAIINQADDLDATDDSHRRHALAIVAKTSDSGLHVSQSGEAHAAEFVGGTGVRISSSAEQSLHVEVSGTGNAAHFVGGGGVNISGVRSDYYPLTIAANGTADAIRVDQGGTGNAAHFVGGGGVNISGVTNGDASLYIDGKGDKRGIWVNHGADDTGYTGYFGGGAGVKITSSAERSLHVEASGSADAIRVDQSGTGNAAHFVGGSGVNISGVDDSKASLYIEDSGNKPALMIDKSGSDNGIRIATHSANSGIWVKQTGDGRSATFEGGDGVHIDTLDVGTIKGLTHLDANNYNVVRIRDTGDYNGEGHHLLKVGFHPKRRMGLYGGQVTWVDHNDWYTVSHVIARFEGDISCVDLHETSDGRLKDDVKPISGALELALKLEGVRFHWKSDPTRRDALGFVAQDVEKVFPSIVDHDERGYKSVSYTSLIPVLLEAMRELKDDHQQQITALERRIERLEARLAGDAAEDKE